MSPSAASRILAVCARGQYIARFDAVDGPYDYPAVFCQFFLCEVFGFCGARSKRRGPLGWLQPQGDETSHGRQLGSMKGCG